LAKAFARVGGEERLQPLHGEGVQVIGRLVQEQQVGAGDEQAGQGDAHAPAAGERAAGALHLGLGEAQPGQHLAGLGLPAVAAQGLEAVVQVAVVVGQPLGVLGGVGHAVLQVAQARLEAGQLGVAGEGLGQHRGVAASGGLLPEGADADAPLAAHGAVLGGLLARDQVQEGALAPAVGADHADAVAGVDHQGHPGEQRLAAHAPGYVLDGQHGTQYRSTRPPPAPGGPGPARFPVSHPPGPGLW